VKRIRADWMGCASIIALLVVAGCSNSSTPTGGTGGSAGSGGSGGAASGGSGGSGGAASGGSGGSSSDAGCVELTVNNFLNWCAVSINGGTPSTEATITSCVPAGTVDLTATAAPGFEIGTSDPWISGTTADKIDGGTTSATVTAKEGTSACVFVCCPFAEGGTEPAGSGCTGITNPCM
jgi:hypothetical protein